MPSKVSALSDRTFENLSYDLLLARGVQNLVWRTPGSDTGRDLEGSVDRLDFAGYTHSERWYFECKRYNSSLSWPIVFEKVSYARNANATCLLFLTTSQFSPNCVDEVNLWNGRLERPLIRQWPGHEIDRILTEYPFISLKFGIADAGVIDRSPLTSPLIRELVKACSSAYSASEFGSSPQKYVEVAAAISDLVQVRTADLQKHGKTIIDQFDLKADKYLWLGVSGQLGNFDRCGIRAICALVRLQNNAKALLLSRVSDTQVELLLSEADRIDPNLVSDAVKEICLWCDIEPHVTQDGRLCLTQRTPSNE